MWVHRKNVSNRDNPEEKKSVEILEVKMTKKNLAYLKEAVRLAEERLATLGRHFGEEAVEDQDRRMSERRSKLSEADQKTVTYSMPKLQLWPNSESEMDLSLFADAIKNLPPVQEKEAEEAPSEENLPDEEEGGFEGLESIFGNRNQGR